LDIDEVEDLVFGWEIVFLIGAIVAVRTEKFEELR